MAQIITTIKMLALLQWKQDLDQMMLYNKEMYEIGSIYHLKYSLMALCG